MRSVHHDDATSRSRPRARAAQLPHPEEAPCFKRAAAGFVASCAALYAVALAMAMVS
jgi:hypothetical protein